MIKENGLNRKTSFANDLKGSYEKMSTFDKDDFSQKTKQTLLRNTTNLQDIKLLDTIPTHMNLDSELMAELISNEVDGMKKGLLMDYMKIAEKAEKELQNADLEKTHLIADKNQLLQQIQVLRQEYRNSREEMHKLEKNLQYYMTEYENQQGQYQKLKESYDQYEKLHSNIEKSLKSKIHKIVEENDAKISELDSALKKMTVEKSALITEKSDVAKAYQDTDSFAKHQSNQIAELTIRNSKLTLENDSIRTKINQLSIENGNYLEEINQLKSDLIKLQSNFRLEMEQTTKTYEIKLKTVGLDQEKKYKTSAEIRREDRFSELFSLQVPEFDQYSQHIDQNDIQDRGRRTTDLDKFQLINEDELNFENIGLNQPVLLENGRYQERSIRDLEVNIASSGFEFQKKKIDSNRDDFYMPDDEEIENRKPSDTNFFVS